jgi:hypothetical protein
MNKLHSHTVNYSSLAYDPFQIFLLFFITQSHLVHVAGLGDCDQLIPVHGVVLLFILSCCPTFRGRRRGGGGYFTNKQSESLVFYSYVKRQCQCDFVIDLAKFALFTPIINDHRD